MSKYSYSPVNFKLVIKFLSYTQKTCHKRAGYAYSICCSHTVTVPVSTLDSVALRPFLLSGLPLALIIQLLFTSITNFPLLILIKAIWEAIFLLLCLTPLNHLYSKDHSIF